MYYLSLLDPLPTLISIPSTLSWDLIVAPNPQAPGHHIITSDTQPSIIIMYPAHIADVTGFSIVPLFAFPDS